MAKPKSKTSNSIVKPPVLIVGVVVIILIVGAVYLFLGYRAQAGHPPLAGQASQVSISNPAHDTAVEALTSVAVDAMAAGPHPFASMELWVNGELMGVQAAPSQGKTPFSANFSWLPKEEGNYSLVARAIDQDGQASTSPAVLVIVNPNDGEGQLSAEAADMPAVLPSAGGGYSPPAGPASGDSVGPADDWQGSPGDWVNSLTNKEPPNAPEIVLQTDPGVCMGDLSIHDLSDNEEGFAVNVQINGGNWVEAKTLASQSQNDWIVLNDLHLAGGQTSIYVTAFNSEGEAQSNIVTATKSPGDCTMELLGASQNQNIQLIKLDAITLPNADPPDQLYCYRSINSGNWVRFPDSDYFYPEEDGSFSLNEVLDAFLADNPYGLNPDLQTMDLECWGWYTANLEYLGNLHYEPEDGLQFGKFAVANDALKADLQFEQLDGDWPFYQLDGDLSMELNFDVFDKTLHSIIDPLMHPPAAYVTYDPDECTNHLPPDAQNLLGTILFCFPYPGFQGGLDQEVDNPQPYLVWNFFNGCNDGYGDETNGGPCKSYQAYLQEAQSDGSEVGFIIHDWSSAGHQVWTVKAPNLRMFNIPPNGCTGGRTFRVVMYHKMEGFTQYSPSSNDYTITCPKPVGNVVTLDLTFENITFHNVEDGEDEPQDVEVYGNFQVMAPSSQLGNNNYLQMGAWDEQYGECPDDTGSFTSSNPPGGCTQVFHSGSYSLYNVPLCKSSDPHHADKYQCSAQVTSNYTVGDLYQTNNNRLRIDVQDGDGINLAMVFYDWDDASGNDLVCWGFNSDFDSGKSVFQWHAMDGQNFALIGFGDDGMTCTVEGVFHVVE